MMEEVFSIELPVGERLLIQKNVIAGREPESKRLTLVTGIHGDEFEGQYICYEVARRLKQDLSLLKGTVEIYPALNPLGLDVAPRWSRKIKFPMDYIKLGYCPICTGNTPEKFKSILQKALTKDAPAVIINAWNEWTEGMALLPDEHYQSGFLDAIKETVQS